MASIESPATRPAFSTLWTPRSGTLAAIAAIWTAVVLASLFSPDLVHGSEHEHLPIAALTWWFWGLIATAFVLVPLAASRQGPAAKSSLWFTLAASTAAIWLLVTLLSVFTERHVTGSDPTEFPVVAVFGPPVAMAATGIVAAIVTLVARGR
jgi:hypothetical protein